MKGNTKTLVIFVVIAVMAMFTVVSMASAKGDKVYAGGIRASCIVTTSTAGPSGATDGTGFDANFKLITPLYLPPPLTATWWTTTETTEGVITYHNDGTVSREFHSVSLNVNPNVTPINVNASSSDSTALPTPGRVHPGESFTASYELSGILANGYTWRIDTVTVDGYFSGDGMTMTTFTPARQVETQKIYDLSGQLYATYHRICTRAATLVRIK
jgi:hypothetical protein